MNDMSINEGRRYQIINVLGRGGFGTVYLARLTTEGGFTKVVALKVLNPDMAGVAEVASRLRDEARVLGLISHRAILQVDALVMLDGRWTVVMEYVEGIDLAALIKRGPVPLGPALEITREVAGALHVAYHDRGPDGQPLKLIHRDIKPPNIRLTEVGEVKVLDFGIARADFDDREAMTRSIAFGTPDYMSPERMEFQDGPEGDVYAVGVVLYELLTGERFGRTSPAREKHEARVMAALDKLWQVTGGRSEELVRFVGSMLACDPAARPTHREVERRCQDLWRSVGDISLRDWAEQAVPPILEEITREDAPDDALLGRDLSEQTRSGAIPYPTERLLDGHQQTDRGAPAPRPASGGGGGRGAAMVGIAAAALVVALLALGVVIAVVYPWGDDELVATDPPVVETTKTETPVTDDGDAAPPEDQPTVDVVEDEPEPDEEPAEEPSKSNVTNDVVPPKELIPSPPPPVPSTGPHDGTVKVKGDAEVMLVRGSARLSPGGGLVPGTYRIQAAFPGEDPRFVGQFRLNAGETVTVACDATSGTCRTE